VAEITASTIGSDDFGSSGIDGRGKTGFTGFWTKEGLSVGRLKDIEALVCICPATLPRIGQPLFGLMPVDPESDSLNTSSGLSGSLLASGTIHALQSLILTTTHFLWP